MTRKTHLEQTRTPAWTGTACLVCISSLCFQKLRASAEHNFACAAGQRRSIVGVITPAACAPLPASTNQSCRTPAGPLNLLRTGSLSLLAVPCEGSRDRGTGRCRAGSPRRQGCHRPGRPGSGPGCPRGCWGQAAGAPVRDVPQDAGTRSRRPQISLCRGHNILNF